MKCRLARSTSRIRSVRGALAVAVAAIVAFATLVPRAGLAAPQAGILPPDYAVRPYVEGRDLAQKGLYREAIPKLEKALETGHEKPRESFGTSRHAVDYYDPHYWLGVAFMEMGEEARALSHLRSSASGGSFPNRRETEDRTRRIAELERREAARLEPPAREPTPAPVPSPTPPPPLPTSGPNLPVPTPATTPPTGPTPVPIPGAPEPTLVPSPPPVRLAGALAALAAGNFEESAALVRAERRRSPGARELDLVEASALGSRYVLEGRRDEALLSAARALLASFRQKGGAARAEASLISPTLRTLLEPR
jgi:tetratricopeptide (TPR) repeat protein